MYYTTTCKFTPITFDGKAVRTPDSVMNDLKANLTPSRRYIGGIACKYGKPHLHRGRFEVMARGCFATTMIKPNAVIRFVVAHDEGELIATTMDGLKLRSDNVALYFALAIPNSAAGDKAYRLVKSGEMTQMSVGYSIRDEEDMTVAGETVRFIRAATLNEISLVKKGAVPGTNTKQWRPR
jgi:HK97 family phage prohead protease